MIKNLQIALLLLLSVAFAISVPTLWLGVSSELSLFAFLSGWQVFGSLTTTLAIYTGIIAYIFGWNPQGKALNWFRENVLVKALQSATALVIVNAGLSILILFAASFLYGFSSQPNNSVVDAIYAENYAAADRELASIDMPDARIAALFFVNDSIRQQFFSTSQNADKNLCRVYLNYFSKTNQLYSVSPKTPFFASELPKFQSFLKNAMRICIQKNFRLHFLGGVVQKTRFLPSTSR